MNPILRLLHFGYHQAMSCIFPVAIFGTLILTDMFRLPFIHRYDLILLASSPTTSFLISDGG